MAGIETPEGSETGPYPAMLSLIGCRTGLGRGVIMPVIPFVTLVILILLLQKTQA